MNTNKINQKIKSELILITPIGSLILVFIFGLIVDGVNFLKNYGKIVLGLFLFIELISIIIYWSAIRIFNNVFDKSKNILLVSAFFILNLLFASISYPEIIDLSKPSILYLIIIGWIIAPITETSLFKKLPKTINNFIGGSIGLIIVLSVLIFIMLDLIIVGNNFYKIIIKPF